MVRITDSSVQEFEKKHIDTVRKAATECTLFLKKNSALPLNAPCTVALFGNGARKTIKGGTGSGDVNVRHFVTVEEGLENAGFSICTKDWLDKYDEIMEKSHKKFAEKIKREAKEYGIDLFLYCMGKTMPEPEYELELSLEGELALYILARNSGEGTDRTQTAGDIELTETEIRDIRILNEKYEKFILVLNTGGLINLEPVKDVSNIFILGQLGTPTGDVLADILLGKSYPSGKLAMTWAPVSDYPSTEGFGDMDDTYYREGIYVGYRYFDLPGKKPSYPFGYGLSYTDFQIKTKEILKEKGKIFIKLEVTNTGSFRGKEVVQIYYSAPSGKLDKPLKELAAFAKTKEINPGESEILTLEFSISDMASYDTENAAYLLEKGEYKILAGNSSDNTALAGILELKEDIYTEKLKNICKGWDFTDFAPDRDEITGNHTPDREEVTENPALGREDAAVDFSLGRTNAAEISVAKITLTSEDITKRECVYSGVAEELPKSERCSWQEVAKGNKTIEEFAAGLEESELIYLCMGQFEEGCDTQSMIGIASKSVAGAAGETTFKLNDLELPTLVMADGPAGLRLSTKYKIINDEIKGFDNPFAGFMEFLDEEDLQKMMPEPSKEEQGVSLNYVYCTAIPIGTDVAQSWNVNLGKSLGDIIGEEMEMFGVHLWLAPAMNIQRSPLCGRDFEYYSEDPVLSGCMAAAITNGLQKHKGCGATIKHFAANNQETNRQSSNSIVSERALREIYLKSFEVCLKNSAPKAVMSSYNLVNGEHTCNSRELLTDVLRNEWGYKGFVMTDWYAADSLMLSNSIRKNKHVQGYGSGCIYAGNDLIMPGVTEEYKDIENALTAKDVPYPITKAQLKEAAVRVLKGIQDLGAEAMPPLP